MLALVVIAGVGAFGASRWLGGGVDPLALRPAASSPLVESGAAPASSESIDASAKAAPLALEPPPDAPDVPADAGTEADGSEDAATPLPRPLPLEDFRDPWAKPPTR